MEPWETGKIKDVLAEAIRNRDALTIMRIVTEQIESTQGAEKAYWLRYRAAAKRLYGDDGNQMTIEADLAEAVAVCPEDASVRIYTVLNRTIANQCLRYLAETPRSMWHAAWERLAGDWRFWSNIGYLHYLRRRYAKAYRAYTRTRDLYLNISPEERKHNGGWAVPVYCSLGRAALRLGRVDEAVAAVAAATAVDRERERKHLNPMFLAVARGELAFAKGQYRVAIEEIQIGMSRVAAGSHRRDPVSQLECDLIAARVARAEGNLTAFQHFCEQARVVASENGLSLSEAQVRAVLNGALW